MKIIHRDKLKHVGFTLARGDLFDADVDAIVNSEQTDFVLSRNPNSISGQIWHRYGDAIQQELSDLTRGQILRPGSVLKTSGGKDFKCIFHAGFHEPDPLRNTRRMYSSARRVPIRGPQAAEYFELIGSCISQVLDEARTDGLASVAFPLIGCGLFGLDEKMLLLQFIDALETFGGRLKEGENLDVWLVILDRDQLESIMGVLLELVLHHQSETTMVEIERSGVPILDRFAARLTKRSNEDWAKWQLCRFAEIAVEIMCYSLCRATASRPESLFVKEMAATFGTVYGIALERASALPARGDTWGANFFARVLKNKAAARALEKIITQRNNLAHGRDKETASLAQIKALVVQSVHLSDWIAISEVDGELRLADWVPWVSSKTASQTGLFERWYDNHIRYLVPETGEVFKEPWSPVQC
jgi:O-acetyl-ADP-ribose deacetylase (regulator of RNase III)